MTEITELSNDEDAEDGCEKPHYLKIITTNEKGYFLVAKNDEEKKQWFFRIKRQLDLFVKAYEVNSTSSINAITNGFNLASANEFGNRRKRTQIWIFDAPVRQRMAQDLGRVNELEYSILQG